ncbi:hypothetical protein RJ639_035584 [Escallonia herrerae]|uniref:Vesicle-fusing ATPase n=1 Tax=Escallonia herrerae TaxID=1293975 RepID=A0AA88WQN8_9ASTE|nr:hypothetical protein RJ639_035584 [Escallonia herrerae]
MAGAPLEVSVAVGLLISELSEEPWKGKLITFSEKPRLISVEEYKNLVVLGEDQTVSLEHDNTLFNCTVIRVSRVGIRESVEGRLSRKTKVYFRPCSSQVKITGQQPIPWRAFQKNLNMDNIEQKLLSLGLGGMSSSFEQIVQRAFVSRFMPEGLARTMGYKHVRGMVLYGPPGTGKTLVARTMAKIFDAAIKVVNGPELFGKYIGESEKNVREIFAEAIEDHITQEINSLALQARGSKFEGGTGDRVVNQLLTMIDGFRELNNIFLIGTTNRLDLVDQAMLRPGRLELQLKVDLPDGNARLQILEIHCKKMRQRDHLSPDIKLQDVGKSFFFSNLDFLLIKFYNLHVVYVCIASRTVGWSGAQLEAVCNGALSLAMSRTTSGGLQFIQEEDIKVLQSDFDRMIEEIDPAMSKSVLQELKKLSGKTTTAALVALKAKVQHVNMISLDTFPKLSEVEQCKKIVQATKLLVIGTTSQKELLGKVGIADQFFIEIKIRSLQARDARKILQHLTILQEADLDVAVELLDHIPIKKLYRLVDFASAAIVENTSGRREIGLSSLRECMKFVHANPIQGGGTHTS